MLCFSLILRTSWTVLSKMYTLACTTKKAQINLRRQHCREFQPKRLHFPVQLSTGNREVVADDINGYMLLPKLLKVIIDFIDFIVYINFYLFLWLDFKCLCKRTFPDCLGKKKKKKKLDAHFFFLKVSYIPPKLKSGIIYRQRSWVRSLEHMGMHQYLFS